MDTQWCLTCSRHLEGDADIYCSPDCYNYDNPSPALSSVHDVYDALHQPAASTSRWPAAHERARILAWAHGVAPGAPVDPHPAHAPHTPRRSRSRSRASSSPPSTPSKPKLLTLRRTPLPPSLSMALPPSSAHPASPAQPILTPRAHAPSADDHSTLTTATTAADTSSIATPDADDRPRRGLVGALARHVRTFVAPSQPQKPTVAKELWGGGDAMLAGWFAPPPAVSAKKPADAARGRKPERAYAYC